jgi:hypothetical protein
MDPLKNFPVYVFFWRGFYFSAAFYMLFDKSNPDPGLASHSVPTKKVELDINVIVEPSN